MKALSRFLSCASDKVLLFFAILRKKEKFEWTPKCEEAFAEIKEFVTSPLILTLPKEDSPLLFYLLVTKLTMSQILVKEIDKAERPIHFIRKVFKGANTRYHKIKKVTLAVVTATSKLQPYFQGHDILVTTNYLVCQVLKKPDLEGRMVSWSVELSEYKI